MRFTNALERGGFAPMDPGRITPELRHYLTACVRAASPSRARSEALRLLGADGWDVPDEPVDWDAVEAEARRQGCTVADIVYDRAGRHPDEP